MCLLINKPADVHFTRAHIEDFYKRNDDGFGIMYAENNVIHTVKIVGTVDDVFDTYMQYADHRECAMHFRMKTHGDIDLDNCHPYEVFGKESGYPLYLMHNGVLFNGNTADTTKSDTWHFINDYVRPMLTGRIHEFQSEWFKTVIEKAIGSNNKFVMMDAAGNTVVFNETSGVTWSPANDGSKAWMSNTYAWSYPRPAATYGYYGSGNNGYYGSSRFASSWDDDYPSWKKEEPKAETETATEEPAEKTSNVVALPVQQPVATQRDDYVDEKQWADAFIDWMYEAADSLNWEAFYYSLSYQELEDFYKSDVDAAWHFIDKVLANKITEEQAIRVIIAKNGASYLNVGMV